MRSLRGLYGLDVDRLLLAMRAVRAGLDAAIAESTPFALLEAGSPYEELECLEVPRAAMFVDVADLLRGEQLPFSRARSCLGAAALPRSLCRSKGEALAEGARRARATRYGRFPHAARAGGEASESRYARRDSRAPFHCAPKSFGGMNAPF
jgi:hypothetical protein